MRSRWSVVGGRWSVVSRGVRQSHDEGGADPTCAGDLNGAPHQLAEALAQRQPQPGAAIVACRRMIRLDKGLKEALYLLVAHADARIADAEDMPGYRSYDRAVRGSDIAEFVLLR